MFKSTAFALAALHGAALAAPAASVAAAACRRTPAEAGSRVGRPGDMPVARTCSVLGD